jgi:hypothetical protein
MPEQAITCGRNDTPKYAGRICFAGGACKFHRATVAAGSGQARSRCSCKSRTLKAYDLVLRAKALALYSRQANEQSRAFARKAIEIDPSSAQAHAYYGYSHSSNTWRTGSWIVSIRWLWRTNLEKGCALDEDDIEAR